MPKLTKTKRTVSRNATATYGVSIPKELMAFTDKQAKRFGGRSAYIRLLIKLDLEHDLLTNPLFKERSAKRK